MPSYCLMRGGGSRGLAAGLGIAAIVIGFILFFFPEQALRFSIYLFGLVAVVIAVILFACSAGMSRSGGGLLAVPLIFGIVALIIGLLSFFKPDIMGIFLAVIIALLAIIAGLGMIFSAIFSLRSTIVRILTCIGGILLLAFGISTLIFTGYTAAVTVKIVGIFLICGGVIAIIAALVSRRGSSAEMSNEWDYERGRLS